MSKQIVYFLVWICCIGLLSAFYFFADPISPNNTGLSYQIEQVVKSIIMVIVGLITARFIVITFLKPIEKKRSKPLPKIVKDLLMVIVFAAVAMYVLLVIYDKNISWLFTTIGSAVLLLGYVAQDTAKDVIAGVIIDVKRIFEVGDWIKKPDGEIAKVVRIGLLDTEVQTPDGIVTSIFNSAITKEVFTNISRPTPDFWLKLSIALAQDLPVKRAARLLQAAAMSAEGVWKQQVSVFASEAAGGNVIYDVRYKIGSYSELIKVRHNVINAITTRLAQYGLAIAEDGGVQTIIQKEPEPVPHEMATALDVVNFVSLFTECTLQQKKEIAKFLTPREYAPGEIIIEEKSFGATMHFIAEGVVEVSVSVTPPKEEKVEEEKRKIGGKKIKKAKKSKKVKKDEEKPKEEEKKEEPEIVRCHICYISNNSFFGENGVLYDSPRNARVSAYSNTLLYELTKDSLVKIVTKNPEILEKITDVIVARTAEREAIKEDKMNSLKKVEDTKSKFLAAFKKFLGI
ncbi:MAG: mechanosensitive ion channel [Holosporales bacterium]|nr:mechanosensitive ion channel [Holosporales bacterium]